MLTRLRENLLYKLLALGFAIALHFYVVSQENPTQTRTLLVQLASRNSPRDLIFDEKTAPEVSVTLTGPSDQIMRLPDADVNAMVDLSRAHVGKNRTIPVKVILPTGTEDIKVAEVVPDAVQVFLAARTARRIEIVASNPGTPPAGYTFSHAVVSPSYAVVAGERDAVDAVKQVVANVDPGESIGTIDNSFPVVALDEQGAQVNDVTVTPAIAHVHFSMRAAPVTRTLLVNYNIVGMPTYPNKVTGVDVSPATLSVTGSLAALYEFSKVETLPIDISGATADVTKQVACLAPKGTTFTGASQVTITVHISAAAAEPAQLATPASPAPLPPAATGQTGPPH